MQDPKAINRQKRGQINQKDLLMFENYTNNELIELLKSSLATERTYAAKLLAERKAEKAIEPLINSLKTEKALYAKIAISESLGNIGLPAVAPLIKLLGKIGDNQHKKLPPKPFEKWNYPLPRDMAARTLIKIGQSAINQLVEVVGNLPVQAQSEAIDAIGYISFYYNDKSAFQPLLDVLKKQENNHLILWKIIRALQSFPSGETVAVLESYITHNQAAIRWETSRSLGQVCKGKVPDRLIHALKDKDARVRDMAQAAIYRIEG